MTRRTAILLDGDNISGTGKNATDLMLAIDATELALRQNIETMVIASSDGDFVHLHRRLREHGVMTIGMGESKTSGTIRNSCSQFNELASSPAAGASAESRSTATEMDCNIRKIIKANSKNGSGMRIASLGQSMSKNHKVKISTFPEKNWRKYLEARKELYDLDPKGPDAHVRFKSDGFAQTS